MVQETLEEVAKSHAIYELENNYKPTKESFKLACKRNFIRGAKWQQEQEKITTDDAYNEGFENGKHWQQERSYTLEQISTLFINDKGGYFDEFLDYRLNLNGNNPNNDKPSFKDWFEQFKKK